MDTQPILCHNVTNFWVIQDIFPGILSSGNWLVEIVWLRFDMNYLQKNSLKFNLIDSFSATL